jgi:PAS domain S-box-containing protein
MMKTVHDVLVITSLPSFEMVEWNNYFTQWLNPWTEPVIGKKLSTLPGWSVSRENEADVLAALDKSGFAFSRTSDGKICWMLQKVIYRGVPSVLVRIQDIENTVRAEQYRALFDKNVAGVFKTYLDGHVIDCNTAFAEILGYSTVEEVRQLKAESFYPTVGDRSRFVDNLRTKGYLSNYQIELKKKNGDTIHCFENTYLDKDEWQKEIIVGTIIDITEQIRSEQALKESEQRFKLLSSVGHEGVVFFQNERITDVNEQFAGLFDSRKREEFIGRKLGDFFAPADLRRILHSIQISSNNHQEIRTQDKSGKSLILDVSGIALSVDGKDMKVLVVGDITSRKKTELVLEQTALRFRNLLENSPYAVIILVEGRIRYLNPAALDLLGVDFEDELYNADFTAFVSDDFKAGVGRDLNEIRNGAEIEYQEIQLQGRNGRNVDVGFKATLTIYENKPAIQISINSISERLQLVQEQMRIRIIEEINTVLKKEIEEHKETQRKLEDQKSYNENLINSSLDMIIASDKDGIVQEANSAALAHFGYTSQEIKGKPSSMLYFRPETFNEVQEKLITTGGFFGEVLNVRKNGDVFTALLSASLIKDKQGKVIGPMGVSRDITQYKANERKALEQKARLESIFNSTENMMMWTMDRSHKATSLNNNFSHWALAELNEKVKAGSVVTKLFKKHLNEDLYQGQMDGFERAFKGRPQQFEIPLKNKLGQTMWLQTFLNPVTIGDSAEEISCIVYDITDRKEIDRRIRDALKEKEVLLQEVHHRVKNNLQVISSILNLQSGYVNDARTLEILQESQLRIKSMSFIHETLYRTSDFSSINFSEYIRTLTSNLIQSYRLQNTEVVFDPDIDEVCVNIDQAIPCGLIINELVSNALKYAFAGRSKGKLSVSLKEKQGKISLSIADDGVGLPASFQFEKTDSLGIQLVYTLIEQLDGKVEVNSAKGTEFLITFDKR